MLKHKVHEVAHELGLSSDALVKMLKEMGIKVRGHMSAITEEEIEAVKKKIGEEKKRVKSEFTRRVSETRERGKKKTPVDQTQIKKTVRETIAKIEKGEVKKRRRKEAVVKAEVVDQKIIKVPEFVTVAEMAHYLKITPAEIIKKCLGMGLIATLNQRLDFDAITLLCSEFGYEVEMVQPEEIVQEEQIVQETRPPVVTVMGHVDHGKTTLLDAIRLTKVAEQEYGRITQKTAAYRVFYKNQPITFLDTPGHEAFTAMRARGAQVTDIVVLVVAADDGVMPQTIEAIDHAKAANVPIIVCVNKTDLPTANANRVKTQLAQAGVAIEEFGGHVLCVEVSALQHKGIEGLLDTILLQAEVLDLKAPKKALAKGVVLDAHLDRGRGNVATVLIQQGTLFKGEPFVCGVHYGRVREIFDDHFERVGEATPSMPVLILGFSGLVDPGEVFMVLSDEHKAREIAQKRFLTKRARMLEQHPKVTLLDLQEKIKRGEVKELKIVLKADTSNSVEALGEKLESLSLEEVGIRIIHKGVGPINISDILLAEVTESICVGFHVVPDPKAAETADREGVEIRTYRLIYEAVDDLRAAMVGLLEPEVKEVTTGKVEVRNIFDIPKVGIIAGCYVVEGKVTRGAKLKIVRDNVLVLKTQVASLKRFKEDVKEVLQGFECGIGLENPKDLKVGDRLEIFTTEEVARPGAAPTAVSATKEK